MAVRWALGVVAVALALGLAACGGVYVLPEPPVAGSAEGAPAAESVAVVESARDAIVRETIASIASAIEAGDSATVWEGLSHETRLVLDHHHPVGGDAALGEGTLWVSERPVAFRPARLLLVEGLAEVRALSREESEAASDRRIEAWIEGAEESRRVVVIREGNVWRLHAPRLAVERLGEEQP